MLSARPPSGLTPNFPSSPKLYNYAVGGDGSQITNNLNHHQGQLCWFRHQCFTSARE